MTELQYLGKIGYRLFPWQDFRIKAFRLLAADEDDGIRQDKAVVINEFSDLICGIILF